MRVGIKFDVEHYKRIEKIYVSRINKLYEQLVNNSIHIPMYDLNKVDDLFSFTNNPIVNNYVDNLLKDFSGQMEHIISKGVEDEWLQAIEKNDSLVARMVKDRGKVPEKLIRGTMQRNLEAMASFKKRTINGMNLSDRVWQYSNQIKGQIELSINVGLLDGRSANEMARDLKKYLKEPDKLFRRVADDEGKLKLSKAAKAYTPSSGVYRSSHQNALRLARTEINMSYRASDSERWKQLDFVVGIEIRRSNREFKCELCESFKGKYPKDFLFLGWHPNCRCYAIPILSNKEEYWAGKDSESENLIKELPQGFKSYFPIIAHKIARNPPLWYVDNRDLIDRLL